MNAKLHFSLIALGLLFLTILTLALTTSAGAPPPAKPAAASNGPAVLGYQGTLTDDAGALASGEYAMRFALYRDPVTTTSVWAETQTVSVTHGLFDVYLGDITPLTTNVFTGQELYLGVKVGADEEMIPRLRLATAPYAFALNQPPCTVATWYRDADADDYGNPAESISACEQPAGYVADNSDCDDSNPQIHPGAPELCNGIDDDCNAETADGAGDVVGQPCDGPDEDLCTEGYYVCSPTGIECNDTSGNSIEVCDGFDNDCDGTVDEGALCDDGVACTIDSCSIDSGGCIHTPDNSACADLNECTVDSCTLTGCENATVPDDTPCTGGACHSGQCTTP